MAVLRIDARQQSSPELPASYDEYLQHPERFYQGSDVVWMIMASSLVFFMIPGLSLVLSGTGARSFALTMFRLPVISAAVVGLEWALWGYSLTFTRSNLSPSWWGGEKRANALMDVVARPIAIDDSSDAPVIPELVFMLFEGMFASFTAALVSGGAMQRARPARFLVFISLWLVLVYSPVARWTWDRDGWSHKLGIMDFAGGTPVHIVGGTTVAAFSVFYSIERRGSYKKALEAGWKGLKGRLIRWRDWTWDFLNEVKKIVLSLLCRCFGRRFHDDGLGGGPTHTRREARENEEEESDNDRNDPPYASYNVNYLVLGTTFLWFGWAGFNGGSAMGGNLRAVSAWASTHIAACTGGVTGLLWIWIYKLISWDATTHAVDRGEDAGVHGEQQLRPAQPSESDNFTVVYFCDGAISGLVAITPAAGYVPIYYAPLFGLLGSIGVHALKRETSKFIRDDQMQIFAVHAGAGVIGMLLTGLLADEITIGLDGHSKIPYPDRNRRMRFGLQLADAVAGITYTFTMTLAILYFMKLVVFLCRRRITKAYWWDASGVPNHFLEDNFQATEMQRWRTHGMGTQIHAPNRMAAPTGTTTANSPSTTAPMNGVARISGPVQARASTMAHEDEGSNDDTSGGPADPVAGGSRSCSGGDNMAYAGPSRS